MLYIHGKEVMICYAKPFISRDIHSRILIIFSAMGCQMCICAAVFVVIMLLCWATRDEKKQTSAKQVTKQDAGDDVKTKWVQMDSTSKEVMKPPIEGPPLGEYPEAPASRYDERRFMELPRGGLSCPNKRWYDAIYNGGTETILDKPDACGETPGVSRRDVKSLWEEDAIIRRRETRVPQMVPSVRHGMMV
jgi:hypothetical protein